MFNTHIFFTFYFFIFFWCSLRPVVPYTYLHVLTKILHETLIHLCHIVSKYTRHKFQEK